MNEDRLIKLPDGDSITWRQQMLELDAKYGLPILRVEFHELASLNDYIGTTRFPGAAQGMIKKWRKKGNDQLLAQAPRQGCEVIEWTEHDATDRGRVVKIKHRKLAKPIFTAAKLTLRYWRPTMHRYDIFSPFIKPVVDGFVDAGMIGDDDQTRIRKMEVEFMGFDTALKLSDEAKETRKLKRAARKVSLLTPSRFWLDFYAV